MATSTGSVTGWVSMRGTHFGKATSTGSVTGRGTSTGSLSLSKRPCQRGMVELLIPTEEIAGVDFGADVIKDAVVTVGDNGIRTSLELI